MLSSDAFEKFSTNRFFLKKLGWQKMAVWDVEAKMLVWLSREGFQYESWENEKQKLTNQCIIIVVPGKQVAINFNRQSIYTWWFIIYLSVTTLGTHNLNFRA